MQKLFIDAALPRHVAGLADQEPVGRQVALGLPWRANPREQVKEQVVSRGYALPIRLWEHVISPCKGATIKGQNTGFSRGSEDDGISRVTAEGGDWLYLSTYFFYLSF